MPPATADPFPRHRRWQLVLATLAGSLMFGVLEAWQGRFLFPDVPAAAFWPEALWRSLPSWVVLAALCPAIFLLARRFRFDRGHRWTALVVHVAAGVAFVFVHLWLTSVFISWRHGGDPSITTATLRMLTRWAVADFFTFWAVAGVVHVAHHAAEARARELAEAELRARLSEARLQALRAQLNPHFLFNTLNSLSTLAMSGERETLQRAVASLADLLRVVLRADSVAFVPLAAELETLDRYLELQALRFGPRLEVAREIAPGTGEASVPSLVLQPLVENAVQHAVGARAGGGRVTIAARRDGDRLALEVRDTGPGFPPDVIAGERAGIGLSNTRERLAQLYGEGWRLECRNAPAGGAVVGLDLPWRVHVSGAAAAGPDAGTGVRA